MYSENYVEYSPYCIKQYFHGLPDVEMLQKLVTKKLQKNKVIELIQKAKYIFTI